ncbi:MAG: hypothetical protein U0W24_18570 [Bacteroidales bacterium]
MPVLNKGKAIYPFWGTSLNLITGLDPLGLQTTSEATYAMLLPGISNLTNRMRYYGFYCWLIDFYFKKEKQGNSIEQYRFIRRAELMLAIIMQYSQHPVFQITGSLFANDLKVNNSGNIYDLADGADKLPGKEKLYWKYPSGAFGQYYYGAMQTIGLITNAVNAYNDTLFYITDRHPRQKVAGKDLAEAFDETLTDTIKNVFYNNVKQGTLKIEDIPELLKFFAIDKIPYPGKEWSFYISMLLDKDYPSAEIEEQFTYNRKNTFLALINNATANNNLFDWNIFVLNCYKNQFGLENNQTDIGWYCYQLNEYWHYACGTIFWAFLQILGERQTDQYLPGFIEEFSISIFNKLKAEIKTHDIDKISLADYLNSLSKDNKEEELFKEIKSAVGSRNSIIAASLGFHLLFNILVNNRSLIPQLREYISKQQVIRDGDMVSGLLFLHETANMPFFDFIKHFVYKRIVYRHELVALRKMNNSMQSTFKFFIDDQKIRYLDVIKPQRTSPRLNALQNLVYDLNIIDENNMLTKIGTEILSM